MRRATEQELTFSEHVKTVCQIRFYRLYQVCTKCTILIAYEEFFLKWDCILIRRQLQATCSAAKAVLLFQCMQSPAQVFTLVMPLVPVCLFYAAINFSPF